MKDRLTSLGRSISGMADAAWDQVPDLTLASDVEVPIYLIHHGRSAEDYEIFCDFERFMTETQNGVFARPVLRVWAGRQDFERHVFARRLREDFSSQFQAARDRLRAKKEAAQSGWLPSLPSLGEVFFWGIAATGSLLGSIVLYIATATGRAALDEVSRILKSSLIGRTLAGRTAEEQLEDLIAEKQTVIDAALARTEITLHRDLHAQAWRGQAPGPMTGMDRDAWPLPDFIRGRLDV